MGKNPRFLFLAPPAVLHVITQDAWVQALHRMEADRMEADRKPPPHAGPTAADQRNGMAALEGAAQEGWLHGEVGLAAHVQGERESS